MATTSPLLARPTILIADDNADMRGYIKSLLERSNDVRAVADGEAAYPAVLESPPDLVLSDVMMPRLDGFGLLDKLRAHPKTQAVLFILLSARAGPEARIESAIRLARERTTRERLADDRIKFEQQLIGIVSHDLRSPITAILMSTQLLLRRVDLDEKITKVIARIQSSAERTNRMIRDLLDFTLVVNLVSNAVKYSPASSPVRVHISRDDGHALLVRAHGGRVGARSAADSGTTFSVWLPREV
ncbi:hybrid sensor histidine kinase/response regulator [Melittangium boletus]|uniref:hybrid sensor histidine kinase/response regulator n=1 Tax=Melittangium boletus TaxID=83453 RepID=UPI0026CAC84E